MNEQVTKIMINHDEYQLTLFQKDINPLALLKNEKEQIFELFVEREKEFSFNPHIFTEYPEAIDYLKSEFLNDPTVYIKKRIDKIKQVSGKTVSHIIILTTYGDKLFTPLIKAGYQYEKIDMPAGPEHTFKFSMQLSNNILSTEECILYLEAVNENDEKIFPTFVMKLSDIHDELCGGVCGSIAKRDNHKFAYIATLVVKNGMPKLAGSRLATEILNYLKLQSVSRVDLGTQTAGRFYEKQGFRVIHRIIDNLRTRISEDKKIISNDLVIMAKYL